MFLFFKAVHADFYPPGRPWDLNGLYILCSISASPAVTRHIFSDSGVKFPAA